MHRISCIVYLLEKLAEMYSNQSTIYLMYDSACALKKHLMVRAPQLHYRPIHCNSRSSSLWCILWLLSYLIEPDSV